MPESGLSGSVRGVPSNGHPYRDPGSISADPVPTVMSGSASSGLRPNCGNDVMGQKPPNALQKRSQEVGPPARCNPFPCDPDRDTLPV